MSSGSSPAALTLMKLLLQTGRSFLSPAEHRCVMVVSAMRGATGGAPSFTTVEYDPINTAQPRHIRWQCSNYCVKEYI